MDLKINDISKIFKENNNFYILTHKSPDGDTLGSAFALCFALQKINKRAKVLCSDEIPNKYKFLYENIKKQNFNPEYIISVDVAELKLLGEKLYLYSDKIDLSIDHHLSNKNFAKYNYIKNTAATAEIIYDIIKNSNIEFDLNIANCIYTGISTDTGCFKYSNTTSNSHRICADMIDFGVDSFKINKIMFDTKSKAKLNIEKIVLESLEFFYNNKCAIITIKNEQLSNLCFCESDFDGIAAIPRQIDGVLIGIFIKEKEPCKFKISIRTDKTIDAAKICSTFNGGGHRCAAGCVIAGQLNEVKHKILSVVNKYLGEQK